MITSSYEYSFLELPIAPSMYQKVHISYTNSLSEILNNILFWWNSLHTFCVKNEFVVKYRY